MEQEIEIKLSISKNNIEKLLLCPFFQNLSTKPIRKDLKNIYFDTDSWQLQSQKIALRIRQSDEQFIQTLKTSGMSEGGLSKRLEWEWNLTDEELDCSLLPEEYWPQDISISSLKAQFNTNFCRRIWYFEESNPVTGEISVIEIALDEGLIKADNCQETIVISELELELKKGSTNVLLAVSDLLCQQCSDLIPSDLSKAARGFQLLKNNS